MKSNPILQELVHELKKQSALEKVGIWKSVAIDLERPTRQHRVVNVSKINGVTQENEVIIVPGKVLGSGELDHKVTVAAYAFSEQAKEKISKAKGVAYHILEFIKTNPKGKGVRIIG